MKVTILTLCLVAFLFTFSTQTFAVDFTVNTTNDLLDTNAGDGICLTTAGNCSLRAAVQEANALATNERVLFSLPANSTIVLTTFVNNFRDILITGSDALEIIGTGANNLTIDGRFSIFTTNLAAVTISGLTITRGGAGLDIGGGIYAQGSALTLDRVYITQNSAGNRERGGGGGIAFRSGIHRIINSTISDNFGDGGCGGILNNSGSTLTIINSTISGNRGRGTGGLCNSGIATLRNVTITNNRGTFGAGGIGSSGTLDFGNTIDNPKKL